LSYDQLLNLSLLLLSSIRYNNFNWQQQKLIGTENWLTFKLDSSDSKSEQKFFENPIKGCVLKVRYKTTIPVLRF
jgi:hypothetical protein